jgi:hypothetical protein
MICVVLLQDCTDFVEGENGSCSETCVWFDVNGSEEGSIKVEAVYIKEEIPETTSFPPSNTEDEVRLWVVCEVVAAQVFRPVIAATRKLLNDTQLFLLCVILWVPYAF